ncbi:MAG: HAMP domain-containing protein [Treponemataceae bacterium]|nr:HAMP domain-containing protein [Treponemataceae bacterium]
MAGKKDKKEKTIKVRFPIGAKLIVIVSFLIIFSLGSITYLVNYFVSEDVRVTAESNNLDANTRSATAISSGLETMRSNALLLMDMLSNTSESNSAEQNSSKQYFDRNESIGAVLLFSQEKFSRGEDSLRLINNKFFAQNELDEETIDSFVSTERDVIENAFNGEIAVLNATPFFNIGMIALTIPWQGNEEMNVIVVLSSSEFLTNSFGRSTTSASYVVNNRGDVIVHPDFDIMLANANFLDSPLIMQMRSNNDENRQVLFVDADGKEYFGAYQKIALGDLAVVTTVQSEIIFENVRLTTKRNIYLGMAVLFISIIFLWLWSLSLSRPIVRLTRASKQIEDGDYEIKLKPKNHDEVGVLTQAFGRMSVGLAERERLQDSFSRFVNKTVVEKAAKGELALGGETKTCTVFFSDIRSFTAISEKLEPYEVVEFLNEYMSRMVDCVNKTHGSVDKYIGDAIMAVWGTPITSGDAGMDALRCVRAALMMRHALLEFNVGRGGDKKPIIKIGCGINSGPVIAGQIGSNQKMEYTVIGDTVNFASRTESLNKPLGTDILITENTYELIKDYVVVERMPSVTVKGKSKPVSLYAVVNMPYAEDIPGAGKNGPKTLAEVRKLVGMAAPDLGKVNLDEEEKKYKIQG